MTKHRLPFAAATLAATLLFCLGAVFAAPAVQAAGDVPCDVGLSPGSLPYLAPGAQGFSHGHHRLECPRQCGI